jgi:hypothetical protein
MAEVSPPRTPICVIESAGGSPEAFMLNIYLYGTTPVTKAAQGTIFEVIKVAKAKQVSYECASVTLDGDQRDSRTPYYTITNVGDVYTLSYSARSKPVFIGSLLQVDSLVQIINSVYDLAAGGIFRK